MRHTVAKEGELFFVYPIGQMTEQAIREALEGMNLNSDIIPKEHRSKGTIPSFLIPPTFVDFLNNNPAWTGHKFIIHHEIDGEFKEYQPKKGKRYPSLKKGQNVIKMSALRFKQRSKRNSRT